MSDDLEAATRAFRETQTAIAAAEAHVAELKARVPDARKRLHDAIIRAARGGMRQIDIVEITGYKREQVRRIVKRAEEADD